MTRLILAAGVAALAIAAPASAGPGGGHGGGGGNPHNNGGGGPPAAQQGGGGGHGHGGGGGGAPSFNPGGGGGHGHGGGGGGAPAFNPGAGRGHSGGFAAPMSFGGGGHGQQARAFTQQGGGNGRGHGGGQARVFAQQGGGGRGHGGGQGRVFAQQGGGHGHGDQQARVFTQQGAGNGRGHGGQQARVFAQRGSGNGRGHGQQANGLAQQQARGFQRQQAQIAQGEQLRGNGNGNGMKAMRAFTGPQFNGAITGQNLAGARMAARQEVASQQFVQQNPRPYAMLSYGNNGQVLPVTEVTQFVGQPIGVVPAYVGLTALPQTLQYLYPATPDYYYQYGGGYLYQVDRTDNLIAALIPLLAGGYLPGQYLPQSYMASYAPDYYGYDAFYPADYGYGGLCNRYEYGVVYQVDCYSGMVENVIPTYAGGYGVGQLLPTAYRTYNVPVQYRSMYYNTADSGYWYAPGAIYQYDPRSSVITSVASLMAPGFTIGQPLPMGYAAYNVPYDYRATYYDTPTAWYRYNNGYIYQVNPATQLVTAIVASLLT